MASRLEQYAKEKYPNVRTPNSKPKVAWHRATVVNVQPHLGHGFIRGSQCYFRPSRSGGWVVFNGYHAIRNLTNDQAKASLKSHKGPDGSPVTCHDSEKIEKRFQFELHR